MQMIRDKQGNEKKVKGEIVDIDGVSIILTKRLPDGTTSKFVNAYEETTGHWVGCGVIALDAIADAKRKIPEIKRKLSEMGLTNNLFCNTI